MSSWSFTRVIRLNREATINYFEELQETDFRDGIKALLNEVR